MGGDDSGGGKGGGGKGGGDSGFDSGSSGGVGFGGGPQYDSDFNVIGPSSSGSSGAPMNIMPDAAQFEPTPTGSFIPSGPGGASSAAGASVATEPGFSSGFSPGAFDFNAGSDSGSPAAFQPGESVPTPQPRPADAPSATPAVDTSASGIAPGEMVPLPQPRPAEAPGLPGVNTGSTTSLANPQGLTSPSGAQATSAPTGASGGDMTSAGSKKDSGGGLGDLITPKNALAAAGAGFNMFQSAKASKGVPSTSAMAAELQKNAQELNAQGKELAKYLQSGTLPEGLKTQLTQATAAAKARLISNYAAQGMPTDPRKNSALAQQLGMIDQQAIITTAQIGQQLLAQGVQESGMASDLYAKLINVDQTQTARIGQAISQMSAALNGGSPTAKKTAA